MYSIDEYMIKGKIAIRGRNYRLDFPTPIIKAMGWKDDKITLVPNPNDNTMLLINKKRKAIGLLKFCLILNEYKWKRNNKQYKEILRINKKTDFKKLEYKDKEYLFSFTDKETATSDIRELMQEEEIRKRRLLELDDIVEGALSEKRTIRKRLNEIKLSKKIKKSLI